MIEKGVLTAVVPWAAARRVFSRHLTRRLAEESVVSHIAAADPSISRRAAVALLAAWFAARSSATLDSEDTDANTQHSTAAPHLDASTAAASAGTGSGAGAGCHAALEERDAAFLEWIASAEGATKVGSELKRLKRCAAARAVVAAAESSEGREGLVLALKELTAGQPALRAQLASMLQNSSSGGSVDA